MLMFLTHLKALANSVRSEERGATAVEYALVLGLVAIALVVAALALTPILSDFVAEIGTWMDAQGVQ
ncbi:Flp family type IVb pilin [Agromyces sp. SYSU T00194]|uniref:Flp family type IVb pilin n=1 Tax=Agromyces chitinivorans TaxID=3158560 RepID=UPI003391F501